MNEPTPESQSAFNSIANAIAGCALAQWAWGDWAEVKTHLQYAVESLESARINIKRHERASKGTQ